MAGVKEVWTASEEIYRKVKSIVGEPTQLTQPAPDLDQVLRKEVTINVEPFLQAFTVTQNSSIPPFNEIGSMTLYRDMADDSIQCALIDAKANNEPIWFRVCIYRRLLCRVLSITHLINEGMMKLFVQVEILKRQTPIGLRVYRHRDPAV